MKIETILSPNFSKKSRIKRKIKFVIIHYTGMQSEIESIKRLCNLKSKVSCHYLINKKGKIIQLVKNYRVAWHAGKSQWKNFVNLNENSIGIELENKGHKLGYENYTKIQIDNLIKLCKLLKRKYKIRQDFFLGHSDIAPLRKFDPGEKFPWKKLSKFKIGLWHNITMSGKIIYKFKKKDFKKFFFKNLYKIGYRYFSINKRNFKRDRLIIRAFQQRYLPKKVTGVIDAKTLKISEFFANLQKSS